MRLKHGGGKNTANTETGETNTEYIVHRGGLARAGGRVEPHVLREPLLPKSALTRLPPACFLNSKRVTKDTWSDGQSGVGKPITWSV